MRELCEDIMDITTILRDQMTSHNDVVATKFKSQCEELEKCVTVCLSWLRGHIGDNIPVSFLQTVVHGIEESQKKSRSLGGRIKEVIKSTSTTDDIKRFRDRICEVRLNFMVDIHTLLNKSHISWWILQLMINVDTNFQVRKVVNAIPPSMFVL